MSGGGLAVVDDGLGWVRSWSAGSGFRLVRDATLGCAEVMPPPRPDRLGGGMELFGLGQGWAQSHKSATPSVGGHADTELAVHLTTSASHAASGGARLRIS